ncbi:MAG: pilus assembly protein PilM [Candidatus Omnitrophica bacterium]|nr:pilus assembly protein PilM [Candidatus Omnitrophota bacterium]MDD5080959.1 pilus assembly protein PilM [Candidatus Omnitrophota bacterium]MDD5440602.1 pilus assembly protein PilM [Candidatus Omnitrophota bacterium]
MSKAVIGLDIGTYSVKAVEVSNSHSKKIIACGYMPLNENEPNIPARIKELIVNSGIKSKTAKISVSGKDVIVRYDVFAYMNKDKLLNSLKYDIEKYVPFPLEDAIIDVNILGKRPDGQMNVVIVSCSKNFINSQIALLKETDIELEKIVIDSSALYNLFYKKTIPSKDKSYIIFRVGHIISTVLIVKRGQIIFSRDVNVGGDNFTRAIAEFKGLHLPDASKLKMNPDSDLENIISIDLNSLINEVEMSIAYCRKTNVLGDIEMLYLCGGSSKLAQLPKILQDKLNINCQLWNPFVDLKKTPILIDYAQEMVLPYGIALA